MVYRGMVDCFVRTVREEGPQALFKVGWGRAGLGWGMLVGPGGGERGGGEVHLGLGGPSGVATASPALRRERGGG